ncbi:MAG TPA: capsule assembly Wzi family protein [Gemmatimonadaceae bacterium]|nr:capsule assembly Wzi family protein [Gemmatimonadaceae bacterium]
MHTGFGLVDGSFLAMLNSAYPEDRNNGALWGGRGVSSIASGGVILKAGVLSIGALPELTYQQNRPYEMLPPAVLGQSAYSSGLYAGIDEPQRFGAKSYGDADWGQSYARLDIGRVAVGISHENLWWGPGISNAVLFTNTAPGFPHVFLNTRRALNVGIGKLTGEAIWGRLSESAYFDTIAANNHRLIVGALLSFEPGWVRGLFLGIGRTFVVPWDSVDARNLFPLGQPFWKRNVVTPDNPNGSNDDQRVSLMARYVLADSKFELYGEWAREDHSWNGSDFVQEPEHSAGHVIGLQKLFTPHATRWVRVYAEASNLQLLRQNRPGVRTTSPFYIHAPQGHTQLGQLLGASIGPGGESEFFGVDIITRGGLVGWYLERVRRDEFAAIAIQAWSTVWPPRHDVTLSGGMRLTRSFGPLRLDADLGPSRRLNRNFIRTESQMRAQVRLTWVPPT